MNLALLAKTINESVTTTNLAKAKVKQPELIMFATQLSVMIDSGVILSDALDSVAEQIKPGPFREIIFEVAEKVKSGDDFSAALSAYPRAFNTMFISMVKASEASGSMPQMLEVLSGYLDADNETRKQVKGALIYPITMMLMAVAATGTLMFFVLPRFTKIYESKGEALPKLTRILVKCSGLLADIQSLTAIVTILIFAGFGFYEFSHTNFGRRVLDLLKVKLPVFGTMAIDAVMTRSMRIMSTMVNTGVSLLDALEVMRDSCKNVYFRQLWAEANERIKDGYQLSESLQLSENSDLVASGIIQMLKAGEKSGSLGRVSDKISIFYEKKLKSSIKNVTALIEPVMIIIMGSIIGTIAIALLLPVFKISSVMSK